MQSFTEMASGVRDLVSSTGLDIGQLHRMAYCFSCL